MSELKKASGAVCCVRRIFIRRHTSRAAELGAVLTVYGNRFIRKGARSVYSMLTPPSEVAHELSRTRHRPLERTIGVDCMG